MGKVRGCDSEVIGYKALGDGQRQRGVAATA